MPKPCTPGKRRRLKWYAGNDRLPAVGDVLRHPVTGSSYRLVGIYSTKEPRTYNLHLIALGFCREADGNNRTIFFVEHPHRRFAHQDQ